MNPREPALLKLFEILGKESSPDQEVMRQREETALHLIKAIQALEEIAHRNFIESQSVYRELSNETGIHIIPQQLTSLLEESNDDGSTPLYLAARNNYPQVLLTLLSKKTNPNTPNKKTGITPLCIAAEFNNREAIRLLLEFKADPNIASAAGFKPLDTALRYDGVDEVIVANLLNAKANPNLTMATNEFGAPIQVAARKGLNNIVLLLLNACANPDIVTTHIPATPLLEAIQNGNHIVTGQLLAHGANPNLGAEVKVDLTWETKKKYFPLLLAIHKKNPAIVELLLQWGANPNLSLEQSIPLIEAISGGVHSIVSLLINAGASKKITWEDRLLRDLNNYKIFYDLVRANALHLEPISTYAFWWHLSLDAPSIYYFEQASNDQKREIIKNPPTYDDRYIRLKPILKGIWYETFDIPKAIKHYARATASESEFIASQANQKLGKLHEKLGHFELAIGYYLKAAQKGDYLSPTLLVSLAQKLESSPKNYSETFGAATSYIYTYVVDCKFNCFLSPEQWLYLAAHAVASPFFKTPVEANRFALQATKKARDATSLKPCQLLVTSEELDEKQSPSQEKRIKTATGYLRTPQGLFYLQKMRDDLDRTGGYIQILSAGEEALQKFDEQFGIKPEDLERKPEKVDDFPAKMSPRNNTRTLSRFELMQISQITGHTASKKDEVTRTFGTIYRFFSGILSLSRQDHVKQTIDLAKTMNEEVGGIIEGYLEGEKLVNPKKAAKSATGVMFQPARVIVPEKLAKILYDCMDDVGSDEQETTAATYRALSVMYPKK